MYISEDEIRVRLAARVRKQFHERFRPFSRPIHSSTPHNLNQNRSRNQGAAVKSKKLVFGAVAATLFAIVLSGCSGFWDPLPGSGSGTGTNPASGVFYVLNGTISQVAGFSFTADTTTPTAVGSPITLPSAASALAISPSGSFLYVSTLTGVYVYPVNSDGSLGAGQSVSQDQTSSIQIDPSGSWLIEAIPGANSSNGILAAIPINPSTGLDTGASEQSIPLPANNPVQLAISPQGVDYPYVFVAMGTGGTEIVHFISGNTSPFGSVGHLNVKNSGGGDNAVAVDPQNRLLYVGETNALSGDSGGLRVLTIGSDGVTELPTGSPYATTGTGPYFILATANYVYVANRAETGSFITTFSLSATSSTYSLSSLGNTSTGSLTSSLAIDNTNTYLLAVNTGGSPADLSTFTFDTTTAGKLDAGPTAATGTDPVGALAIVAAPAP